MYKKIKYFNGLNALRFIAAYLVVIHHAEQIRLKYEMFNLKAYTLFNNGGIAVTFFFVLSGFLITYLLLKENQKNNTVSIKKFYMRRILRIWPLYFLLVLLGTVCIPIVLKLIGHDYEMPYGFFDVIWYYVFFTPFVVNILFGHHLLEALWSIGVEELFYIFWAPVFKCLKAKILPLIYAVIVIKLALLLFIKFGFIDDWVSQIIKMLKFEAMAIGGLGAYLLYHSDTDISKTKIFSKFVQIPVLIIILSKLLFNKFLISQNLIFDYLFNTYIVSEILMIILFTYIIINVSVNPNAIVKLKSSVLSFLGEISYGIYMYHMIIIFLVVLLLRAMLSQVNGSLATILFYTTISGLTILVSFVSKRLYEDPFLKIKEKFNY